MSAFALSAALSASPAQADCSTQDLDQTCSGDLGVINFTEADTNSGQTVTLTIEDATSESFDAPASDSATWTLDVSAPDYSNAPAHTVLDVDLTGFDLNAGDEAGIQVTAVGSVGEQYAESKGKHDQQGEDGGVGGAGGEVTATISGVNVTSNDDNIVINSSGGDGGEGAEGHSTSGGNGYGGDGGDGGNGGQTTVTLTNGSLGSGRGLVVGSFGGTGGTGGEGKASNHTARGGTGGVGGQGGDVSVTLSDLSVSGNTGIVVASQGGHAGVGGDGENGTFTNGYGGSGGVGGNGGEVDVSNTAADGTTGSLEVDATSVAAILAESIAGNGATGGVGHSGGTGGDGGQGGTGGSVSVEITTSDSGDEPSITTTGDGASGIVARSYGGAGGDGGDGDGLGTQGGAGAGSGPGGNVDVSYKGDIQTQGSMSDGIFAQSVGGFAGNAGSEKGIVAYGASSESAGGGGNVTVYYHGSPETGIVTNGDDSDGIFAQSQGGGGGKASTTTDLIALSGDESGSSGGNGGSLTVTSHSAITTSGERSRGLVAQSIGGTGGDGGSARGLVSIGGTGSNGGEGGQITLSSTADITTTGDDSIAILAQSIGGGGGSAGSTDGITALGGKGGSGAIAGDVNATVSGTVSTAGTGADGVLAQSIGGSGGQGSNTLALSVGFSMAIAGDGGTGSDGGAVTLETESGSSITTQGDNARGVAAMSVGGGGGHGGNAYSLAAGYESSVSVGVGGSGNAGGDGDAVTLNTPGSVSTTGDNATAISALSVGGSGGSAGTTVSAATSLGALSLSVGGDASGGGDGGQVDVCRGGDASNATCQTAETAGSIETAGDGAAGVFVASVGGGGGQSGATMSGTVGGGTSLTIAGDGGDGGTGGDVSIYSSGGISTTGMASGALIASSIGGGGGNAHVVGAFGAMGDSGVNFAIGSKGGSALGSGDVTVTSTDTISTEGKVSPGIQATSHGSSGGSGSGVFSGEGISTGSAQVSVGSAGGGGGNSGDVDVTWAGDTLTTGDEQSAGILALSMAGSGGTAGVTFAGTGAGLATTNVSVGGGGGVGGNAGEASVSANGQIQTTGFMSDGIAVISHGGNGGRGGLSITGAGVSQGNATLALGGGGGIGGTANTASAETATGSSITTDGPNAVGINVLSLGGNGGQGGFAIEAGMNIQFVDEFPAGDATLVLGGKGHTGGESGLATVNNSALISTHDFNSPGIQVQSIAGSGGSGGMAVSGTVDVKDSQQINTHVTIGGNGGTGGVAGESQVINVADISTTGDNSSGILSQSIGGSGGAGGMTYNILSNFFSGGSLSVNLGVSVGGEGNDGGTGGEASVNNGSKITTTGTSSSGIYAQSIGGSGGRGGFGGTGIYDFGKQAVAPNSSSVKVNLNATVGGSGGSGAIGGDVNVVNQGGGHITTAGSGAFGIFAQSIGGSGGDGGLASNFSQSLATFPGSPSASADDDDDKKNSSKSVTVTVKIGGNGGSGADAGDVSVNNASVITTTGDIAHGVMSQSVGGGGGTGGGAATNADSFVTREIGTISYATIERLRSVYNVSNLKEDFGTFNFSMGGEGGAAGVGGTSSVTNTGSITTSGTNAYGIFSQSIGGGGGSGGEAASITDTYSLQLGGNGSGGGDGGTASIVSSGTVSTSGYGSNALFAQSIGGGGGNTGSKTGLSAIYDATLTIGGQDGVSGDGGDVSVTYNSGTITTALEQSSGIFAQSVGGGGGTLFGGTGSLSDDASVKVTVGSTGDAGGDGGEVKVVSGADIVTGSSVTGDLNAASIGIFAQSVGGGGGYSGSMILGDQNRIGSNVQGTSDNAWGNGGAVSVNQSGTITTYGDNSVGIFAQSVGGGGGVQGTVDKNSTDGSYVGSFGGAGSAGTVGVFANNTITTSGAGAHGIFAQYAGGDGGVVADPPPDHTVDVQTSGSVYASGAGAHAIHVENMGTGAQDVKIEFGGNSVIQGGTDASYDNAADGAGVYINSDQNSTLGNSGKISALSGVAINSTGGGVLTLNNNGTVTGDIIGTCQPNCTGTDVAAANALVDTSSIYVDNFETGVLDAGEILEVTRLRSWGQIYVGQAGSVSGTHITGDLVQNAGHLSFDIDMSNTNADLLTVDGYADLQGTIGFNVVHTSQYPNGTQTLKVIEASGGLDASALEIIPSVVGQYRFETVSDTELHLSYDVDYANETLLATLNNNQTGLTTYFDGLYRNGALNDDLAKTLIDLSTTEDYALAMNTLGPEIANINGIAGLNQMLGFADTLFSCPNLEQGNIWVDNGQCGYFTFTSNRLDRDPTSDASGFTQNGLRIGLGGQMLLENGMAIGAALAYDSTELTTDAGASSDGNTFSGGLSLKHFVDNWEFGAAVYAGNGRFDNTRNVGTFFANGEQSQLITGTEIRAGYAFDLGGWLLKPRLGLGVTHFADSSYSENGSDIALSIDTSSETFTYLRPALEIGGSFLTTGGTEIRTNAVLSMTQFLSDTSFDATARFVNAPNSVEPVNWQADIDRTQFDLTAGITIMSANGISYDFSAFGHLTDNERGYGGMLRVNIPF